MIDTKYFEDIAKKISDKLPKGLSNTKEDMEKTIKSILHTAFSKLDLVQREEFDAQVKVLDKLRSRIDLLEQKVTCPTTNNKKKS